jgi:hypothetical protein
MAFSCVSVGSASAARPGSKAGEAARFLGRLRALGGRQGGRDVWPVGELYALATDMNLLVRRRLLTCLGTDLMGRDVRACISFAQSGW